MDWEEYASTALGSFADAGTAAELAEAHTEWLGRKSELKVGLRNVRDRESGLTLNAVREQLEAAFTAREAELERARLAVLDEALDVTLPGTPFRRGRLHPLTQIRREVEDIFLGLGYEIVDSREVETVWHNFDALNQPLTHPSRSHRDTFYVDSETLLRTHTSTGQIRVMEERQPPIYIATLGRVYRRDTPSPRSTPNFHQVEALAVDKGISLADLKGTLMHFFRAMFGEDRDVRMRTSFFPFTDALGRIRRHVLPLRGLRLRVLQVHGLVRDGRRRRGRSRRLREDGLRPRGVVGLCLGVGPRPHCRAASRDPGHSDVLGERPPSAEAVLMRVPVSWLRDYVPLEMPARELADRLVISTCEVDGIETVGVADVDGNLGLFRVGRVLDAVKHPNADRLQLCQVDVGETDPRQIVCGAWNFGAGATVGVALPGAVLPGGLKLEQRKVRGEVSDGMILAEDEIELGTDHSGIMVLSNGIEPGTPLGDVLPLADSVLELETSHNRPDLLAVYGIAREVAALFDLELAPPPGTDPQGGGDRPVDVTIEDYEGCPRYIGRLFTNAAVGPSPVWLKARLLAAGMRPISNVVDITNYVMLALGNPLHAFDHSKLARGKIVVRRARPGEKLRTLDGIERELEPYDLMIADGERCVASRGSWAARRQRSVRTPRRSCSKPRTSSRTRSSAPRSVCASVRRARTAGRRVSIPMSPSRPRSSRRN